MEVKFRFSAEFLAIRGRRPIVPVNYHEVRQYGSY